MAKLKFEGTEKAHDLQAVVFNVWRLSQLLGSKAMAKIKLEATERAHDLQVITFNVWRDSPFDVLASSLNAPDKKIKTYQPWGDASNTPRKNVMLSFFDKHQKLGVDIFGLQECTQTMLLTGISACLSEFTAPFLDSVKNQEQIFYRKDKFELIKKYEHNWPSTTNSFSLLKLQHKATGKKLIVANAHLNWQGHGAWTAETGPGPNTRADQMNDVAEAVSKMQNGKEIPIIIMGDLNDVHAPLKVAHERLQVKPSFLLMSPPAVAPHTCPTPCGDPCEEIDSWAAKTYDWVLSKGLAVLETNRIEFNLDGVYPSDHYPVSATYSL